WPIQYAQLNNDVLWVMDETQLMGITVATTAQLQGFREQFGTYGPTRPDPSIRWIQTQIPKPRPAAVCALSHP
ncbi:MAG: hypothetical protein NZ482_10050, partial [Gloeomargarita sp. SKYG98]|nr:hypothetical protein [Gloeomargarita sp. SKYG98]